MSISAARADAFFEEALQNGSVWSIKDHKGFPTSTNASGEKAMPFWSLESRARNVINNVSAYSDFEPHRLTLAEFLDRWLPGMERDRLLVGLNWSGARATGYDLTPAEVRAQLANIR
jgi:hypothetical protein